MRVPPGTGHLVAGVPGVGGLSTGAELVVPWGPHGSPAAYYELADVLRRIGAETSRDQVGGVVTSSPYRCVRMHPAPLSQPLPRPASTRPDS